MKQFRIGLAAAVLVMGCTANAQAPQSVPDATYGTQAQRDALNAAALAEEAARNQAGVAAAQGRWAEAIARKLRRYWAQPPGVARGSFVALQIQMEPDGRVKAASLQQSSGNDNFDRSVLRAAELASPLPLPDYALAFNPVIVIRFCLPSESC